MRSFGMKLVAAVLAVNVVGCTSSTVIQSIPQGATVYLNGAPVGRTPYVMSDQKIVGSSTSIRLEYPGYEPVQASISRSEELDVLACIGGVFLLVPFLWVMAYKADHTYELQPLGGAAAAGTVYIVPQEQLQVVPVPAPQGAPPAGAPPPAPQ